MANNNALPLSYLTVKGVRYAIQDERVEEILQQLDDLTSVIDDESVSTETTYSSSKIKELIQEVGKMEVIVVDNLPTEDINDGAIYLVPKTEGTEASNVKDEYIYTNGNWEKIGDTEIDLSEYATKVYVDASFPKKDTVYTKGEVDDLFENLVDENTEYTGDEITIHIDSVNHVISAKLDSQTFREAVKNIANYTAGSDKVVIDNINRTIDIDVTKLPTTTQVNSDWESTSGVSQILHKPSLATVATSGSYNDLSNKPIIPEQVQPDWNQTNVNAADYIKNKPSSIKIVNATSLNDGIIATDAVTNDIVILTGSNPQTTYTYTNNRGVTKHLTGNVDYDIMFRCCGNDRYQPITLPIPID